MFHHEFYTCSNILSYQLPSISACSGFNRISLKDVSFILWKSVYHYVRSPLFLMNLILVLVPSDSSLPVCWKNLTLTTISSVPSSSFLGRVILKPLPSILSTNKLGECSALKLFKSSQTTPGTTSISKSV